MKSLSDLAKKTFDLIYEDVILDHINNNLSITETYLRMGSDSYNELINVYRKLYESGTYEPKDSSEVFILEKLDTGKKGYYKDGKKYIKVDLDSPKKQRGDDKEFIVYRAKDGEYNGLPLAKKIEWGDPNLAVKNDDKGASDSFWARHKCSEKTDKNTPGWWACRAPELFGDKLKLRGDKNRW